MARLAASQGLLHLSLKTTHLFDFLTAPWLAGDQEEDGTEQDLVIPDFAASSAKPLKLCKFAASSAKSRMVRIQALV